MKIYEIAQPEKWVFLFFVFVDNTEIEYFVWSNSNNGFCFSSFESFD